MYENKGVHEKCQGKKRALTTITPHVHADQPPTNKLSQPVANGLDE
jgi:hypothetical protein